MGKNNFNYELLNSILTIIASLNIKSSIRELIKHLSAETSILLKADRTTIYIYDKDKNSLWSLFAEGLENETIVSLSIGQGLAGNVALTGKVFKTNNAYQEKWFDASFDKKTGYKTESIIAMPMKNIKDELVGVIQVLNKKKSGVFDEYDENILKIISTIGATVLDRIIIDKEIEKKNKLALIGNITSSVTHDIKNPLSVIMGYADMIKLQNESAELIEFCDIIKSECLKIQILLNEVSDFVRGNYIMKFTEMSLDDFIQSMQIDLNNLLKMSEINLTQLLNSNTKIKIDKDRLYRVVINLVKNASEALLCSKKKDKTILIKTSETDKEAVLEIIDNGAGIPNKIIERIFEPFFTSNKIDGTGLGLSIVKRIIENHNAKIEVSSELKKGTDFKITFQKQ